MNTNKAIDKTTVLAIAITILILIYAFVLYIRPKGPFFYSSLQSPQQRRILLLYHSDHEALLKAGREILRQSPDPRRYMPVGPFHVLGFPVPRYVHIPKVVHQLRPHAIYINFDGYTVLQMEEGVTGYGLKIYPEGFKIKRRDFQYVNRELFPGLWYFDEKYERNPEYGKTIDYIIQNGKWPDPNQTDPGKSGN